eukprot:CAMPEP_0194315900 /NCGR_PEP_ID=MMETSP0171-20130528/12697_1 /TAXON_ID=218684 /ORGANISM="Corethron pennatum, Strain L29A3" /LENGTH=87 /DNA_ID=CAMNT_0039071911 /DNA_START=485 /DNA_END=748 /DNA_ORIENTATION=-
MAVVGAPPVPAPIAPSPPVVPPMSVVAPPFAPLSAISLTLLSFSVNHDVVVCPPSVRPDPLPKVAINVPYAPELGPHPIIRQFSFSF